tara:strand:+ start:1328 stop:1909 length:582 start_codon:yes stop_codon:yes gene_type:complete
MKLSLAKAIAAVLVAGALLVAAPSAAFAGYPPPGTTDEGIATSTFSPGPGGTFAVTIEPTTFVPGETVSLYLTGENASSATLATVVKMAIETERLAMVPALSDGTISPVTVRLPSNATGNYIFTASSPSLPEGISLTVTVAAAGGESGDGIAVTGTDSALTMGLWVGGGALLLAGGAIVVASAVRRQRQNAGH